MSIKFGFHNENPKDVEVSELSDALSGKPALGRQADLDVLGLTPDEQRDEISKRHKNPVISHQTVGDLIAESKANASNRKRGFGDINELGAPRLGVRIVSEILKNDGLDEFIAKATDDAGQEVLGSVAADTERRRPSRAEVEASLGESAVFHAEVDGIMKPFPTSDK